MRPMTVASSRRFPDPALPDWDGSIAAAFELQVALAARVVRRDDFSAALRTVAGFDVGLEDGDSMVRVAAVSIDANTNAVLERQVVRLPVTLPPQPDLLGFIALPAMLQVLGQLAREPDLLFVDGHGRAHPRRLGMAAHFGVAAGLPSIGVSSQVLVGTTALLLHQIRGAHTPLRDRGEHVGWLLRSKVGYLPLVVSPGHRVSMTAAAQLVMRFVTGDRRPEPIRLAVEDSQLR